MMVSCIAADATGKHSDRDDVEENMLHRAESWASEGGAIGALLAMRRSQTSTNTNEGGICKSEEQNSAVKNSRFTWSNGLRQRFVDAVTELGGAQFATPGAILKHMGNVSGLTRSKVASYLQKYREKLKLKCQNENSSSVIDISTEDEEQLKSMGEESQGIEKDQFALHQHQQRKECDKVVVDTDDLLPKRNLRKDNYEVERSCNGRNPIHEQDLMNSDMAVSNHSDHRQLKRSRNSSNALDIVQPEDTKFSPATLFQGEKQLTPDEINIKALYDANMALTVLMKENEQLRAENMRLREENSLLLRKN